MRVASAGASSGSLGAISSTPEPSITSNCDSSSESSCFIDVEPGSPSSQPLATTGRPSSSSRMRSPWSSISAAKCWAMNVEMSLELASLPRLCRYLVSASPNASAEA